MTDNWVGRVALITGAGSGIGAGIAHAAADAGMVIVVADIRLDRASAVAEAIVAAGGRAEPMALDVTDEKAVRALSDHIYRDFGEIRMLVNNAGIMNFGPSWELTTDQWHRVFEVNVMGVVHGITVFLPRMVEAARSGRRSALVNVASLASIAALPMSTAYVMSKHAVLALSECLSLELALEQLPVDVSVVLPGNIDTQIYDGSISSFGASQTGDQIKKILVGMANRDGMSPDKAGQIIFQKVRAGDFWVPTDPVLTDQTMASRLAFLRSPTRPQLPPAMEAALRAMKPN